MKKQLQAIFFDIDDTLFPSTKFANTARSNAIQAMVDLGLEMPFDELYNELTEVVNEFSSNYGEHFQRLFMRIPQKFYHNIPVYILIAAAVRAYHNTKKYLEAYPDVITLLENIKEYSIVRGIITSGREIKQAEKILSIGVYKYLTPNAIFITDQVGICKPNPKLYQKACDVVGANPENSLYVGDNHINDIDPANRIGMTTVLVRKNGKYQDITGSTTACYTITDFSELWDILQKNYDLR